MRKLVDCDKEEVSKIEQYYGWDGHPNHAPNNFQERDEAWFAQNCAFRIYGFNHTWYQQVYLPWEIEKHYSKLLSIHCFGMHDGTGFAIHEDYWGKKVRYFSFAGCIHEFREPTKEECAAHHDYPGKCYHVSICDKCGYWRAIDSSD